MSPMAATASAVAGTISDPRESGVLNQDELGLGEQFA